LGAEAITGAVSALNPAPRLVIALLIPAPLRLPATLVLVLPFLIVVAVVRSRTAN